MVLMLNKLRSFSCKCSHSWIYFRNRYNLHLPRFGHSSAGIIVIGDEVLKGQVQDTNSFFLSKQLYKKGYQVEKVLVVPDDVKKISEAFKVFSKTYNKVLSTGGIGPTHDDVTFEALAEAFQDQINYHPKLVKMCREFFKIGDNDEHPGLKLAKIPESAVLTYGIDPKTGLESLYPNISLRNVFIFPGVPSLCEKMYFMTHNTLFPSTSNFCTDALFFNSLETDLTMTLNEAVAKFPAVKFGSYPIFFHSYFKVKITLESNNEAVLYEAKHFLSKNIQNIVSYDSEPFKDKFNKLMQIDSALLKASMEQLLLLWDKVNPDDLFLYFDGGKNSTLLLHLLSVLLEGSGQKINIIYIEKNKKVTTFVKQTVGNYPVNLLILNDRNFVRFIKSDKKIVLLKATRLKDPKSSDIIGYFSQFNTYNPLLHWSYFDVWEIIRKLCLPYCDLYDQGFSSLTGSKNPKLVTDGPRKDVVYYKSAYQLSDESFE